MAVFDERPIGRRDNAYFPARGSGGLVWAQITS